MALFSGPSQHYQQQPSHSHTSSPSSPIQLEYPESHLEQNGPTDLTVSPHLRHGHHHHDHPNNYNSSSLSANISSLLQRSVMEVIGNNSHNPVSSSQRQYFSNDDDNDSISSHPPNFSLPGGIQSQASKFARLLLTPSSESPLFPVNMSISEEDFETSYDNNSTLLANTSISTIIGNVTGSPADDGGRPPFIASLYAIIVPVMIFFCALTCIVNLVIVISARWCRKPMSPTLYYSISLALADAFASFILGVGLTINSLLPRVYNIQFTHCLSLTIEAFRSGGVLVTVCHLLALGINHWIGIARPLHYAATMTRRTAWIVIIISWSFPILMLLIYYSSIPNQGFQSSGCSDNTFMRKWTYRVFFASCFFAPLFLLSLIYIHIFLIVRSHQTNRLRYQVKKKSCQALRKNVKAALTTVLILGTYIVGWMPATLYNIIACEDCIIHLSDVPPRVRYAIGITVNVLVILKTFVDPIIYAARMSDIQLSLRKMKYDFLQLFCKCVNSGPPPENNRGYFASTTRTFSKFNRSLYDTKSIRMSSFGSSSSSRRPGANAAAAANLANNSNNSPGHSHRNTNHHNNHGGGGGLNNSFNYKNQNGNNKSPNHLSSHPQSHLLHTPPAFEMQEMH